VPLSRTRLTRRIAVAALSLVAAALAVASCQLHSIGAGALLFPSKRAARTPVPAGCVERTFRGADVTLKGWHCVSQSQPRQGVVVYLHGIADNRSSAAGVATRFTSRGFDFVAYDSRAHGVSEGKHCTYGYYEKHDLRHVLDEVGADRVVLIGHSLGAAVALQTAAIEPRVSAVVAAASFSDLRTIATERAPFIFSQRSIAGALARAERDGRFRVDEVSPVRAASAITAPVLLIHGESDHNTLPAHSRRIFDALRGPKRLLSVPGAGHNDVLNGDVWRQLESWIASAFDKGSPPP
jgi:alpha-beta hydrolase superfamily lysophospholipase